MEIAKFAIPGKLPGLNDVIGAARKHWGASAKQKKATQELCMFWINAARIPKIEQPVLIHFDWYEPNARRDCGNIRGGEKFVSDALVELGKLPNDNQQWVKGMSDRFLIDRDMPRVVVTILGA